MSEDEELHEIKTMHSGRDFPQVEELEQFVNILIIIKQNYHFMHPKDINEHKLDRFITCSDFVNNIGHLLDDSQDKQSNGGTKENLAGDIN